MLTDSERTLANLISAAVPLNGVVTTEPVVAPQAWPRLVATAQRNGLAPLLYESLKTVGRQHQPPDYILESLRGLYAQASATNWWAYQELAYWLECFTQAQIPVVLLKGCALAKTLYAGIGLRRVGDLDLLIPRSAVPRARALLFARGYTLFTVERRNDCEYHFASQQAFWRDGKHPSQLDMHWHPFGSAYYFGRIPVEWFWQRTMDIQLNDHKALIFTAEAQLLHLSAHFALQQGTAGLKWSYDIALLLSRYADQIDWQGLSEAIDSFGLIQAMQATLASVHNCWGTPVSADVSKRLAAIHPAARARIAYALTAARRSEALMLWQGLTTPGLKMKLQFWRCYVFPSAQYMRMGYRFTHAGMLPVFYVWRIIVGLYRVARSALAMLAVR